MERLKVFFGRTAPVLTFLAIWLAKLVAHESDPFKVALAVIYPPESSYGGVAVQLRTVARPQPSGTVTTAVPTSLLLIQHEKASVENVSVMSADVRGDERVAAGTPTDPPPRLVPVTDTAVGSSIIMQAELPPQLLLGVVISEPPGTPNALKTRFSYRAGDTVKTFGTEGELVIRTKNGQTDTLVFYVGLVGLAGWCAGHAFARKPRLIFPHERETPKLI
jgi:hypothetical protein